MPGPQPPWQPAPADRELGRLGRIRADSPSGTAINKGIDVFAAETITILGPPAALSRT